MIVAQPPGKPLPPHFVWWILWAAFFAGLCQIYYFLAVAPASRPAHPPADSSPFMAALGLLPLAASIIVRWAILPRMTSRQQALPAFILGIALAEATCYLGIFFFPAFRLPLFVFSLLGIGQFIPVFAKRFN